MIQSEVVKFIERRFPVDNDWMTTNSYWFAKILTLRFAALQLYFIPSTSHFIAADIKDDIYFDYDGDHIGVPKDSILIGTLLYEQPVRYLELMKSYRE